MESKVSDAGGATINLVEVAPGYPVCMFGRQPEEEKNLVLNIKHFKCRDDDIFILAPIKSGLWNLSVSVPDHGLFMYFFFRTTYEYFLCRIMCLF